MRFNRGLSHPLRPLFFHLPTGREEDFAGRTTLLCGVHENKVPFYACFRMIAYGKFVFPVNAPVFILGFPRGW